MPQLVTGATGQPGAATRTVEDLIQAVGRQRLPATRALQDDEHRVGRRGWPLGLQVVGQGAEEPAGDAHIPLPTALAGGDEHAPGTDIDVGQTKP